MKGAARWLQLFSDRSTSNFIHNLKSTSSYDWRPCCLGWIWLSRVHCTVRRAERTLVLSSDNKWQRHYPLMPLGLVSELVVVEGERRTARKRMIIEIGWWCCAAKIKKSLNQSNDRSKTKQGQTGPLFVHDMIRLVGRFDGHSVSMESGLKRRSESDGFEKWVWNASQVSGPPPSWPLGRYITGGGVRRGTEPVCVCVRTRPAFFFFSLKKRERGERRKK